MAEGESHEIQSPADTAHTKINRDAAMGIVAANQSVSPEFGSVLDPNVSGNVEELLRNAATDSANANRDSEFAPMDEHIEGMLDSGADGEDVAAHIAQERADNGVANNVDGTHTVTFNGEQIQVPEQGAPVDVVDRGPQPQA